MVQRILAIDDDRETTAILRRFLGGHGYGVREENDSTHALETARQFQPEVVILDYLMPEMHGGDVAWQFASDPNLREVKVIVCTATDPQELRYKLPPGHFSFLSKPVDGETLLRLLGEDAHVA